MRPSGIITLITDFGTRDAYAGAMKGAMLSVNDHARIADITHDVPPHDVFEAAWVLLCSYAYFPPGTVHCVVVDPGVGGARRAIAARAGAHYLAGPDNGVLSWALADAGRGEVVELTDRRYFRPRVSGTFHGRDVFAPVAAHLSRGVPLEALGRPVRDPVTLPSPAPLIDAEAITGQVIHVDRFGNLVTNIDDGLLCEWAAGDMSSLTIECGGRDVSSVQETYASAEPGAILALIGSAGRLEIAMREGSAAAELTLTRSARVVVRRAHRRSP